MNRIQRQRGLSTPTHLAGRILQSSSRRHFWLLIACALFACTPDDSPLKTENQRLKKQLQRQETVIASLQEGNKILQEQIDRLNQDAHAKQQEFEKMLQVRQEEVDKLARGTQAENQKIQALAQQIKKLNADVQWLRTQRDRLRKGLVVYIEQEHPISIPHPFPKVLAVTEDILRQHGYALLTKMQTDQKAVLVTARKTSPPVSLEVPGFRNQYLVTVEQDGSASTKLWVTAEFEKLASNGVVIQPSQQEIQEIQHRLAQEIQRALRLSKKSTASTDAN